MPSGVSSTASPQGSRLRRRVTLAIGRSAARFPRPRWDTGCGNHITEPNQPADDNSCIDTAMASHGIVAASTQGLFHARAWVTGTHTFCDNISDGESLALQSDHVDACHDDIPPQQRRIRRSSAQQGPHYR
jgi:hypothetical protein